MPVRARAVSGRFEKHLVEMQDKGLADEAPHGLDDALLERQGANQIALVEQRYELQVGLILRSGLTVPVGVHVAHEALLLKAGNLGLQGGDFPRCEETGDRRIAGFPKLGLVFVGQNHGELEGVGRCWQLRGAGTR